ncbi:MAG TPA: 50S ribosomal protein L21 [Chloroflexia bacterium]|nr:50S ribosomal protein L21 [Chloroflexia bacterium]
MYAIVKTGGHQYRVAPGDTILVERLEGALGSQVELGEVLMVGGGENGVQVGSPVIEGAKVLATVVAQDRGPKLIVFKYKAKKRYRRKTGHRQNLTRLAIKEISL